MKTLFRKSVPALAGLALCALTASAQDSAAKWQTLFSGTDLSAWAVSSPNPFWTAKEGVLTGTSDEALTGNVLRTRESYGDFEIELETRWEGEIDSGIMLRKPELQLQFGVSRSLKRDLTCSFYTGGQEKYPAAGQAKDIERLWKANDWNRVRLQAKGDTFTVWLNDQQVSQYTDAKYAEAAPIGLQVHPKVQMTVQFRDIRIRRLH